MTFRQYNKYLVLKQQDIDKYLQDHEREDLWKLCQRVEIGRDLDSKKPNDYVVVNEDEPYAEVVWKLIEISVTEPQILESVLSNVEDVLSQWFGEVKNE